MAKRKKKNLSEAPRKTALVCSEALVPNAAFPLSPKKFKIKNQGGKKN